MEKEWRMHAFRADFNKIAAEHKISPVTARVLVNRGLTEPEAIETYLHAGYEKTHDPFLMKDMEKACAIMAEKLKSGAHIRIISDYDVDGVMSNYILLKGLEGASRFARISYEIPDRMTDGYGINERIVRDAHADGVDTLITCDNGIAAFPALTLAKELGMTVIVTDHHEVPYNLNENGEKEYTYVPADAIVDIKRPDCPYPCKEICGVTVAYKFIRALYKHMGLPWKNEDYLIEFVGFATVCDVMQLVDENRIYVKKALELLPRTENIGLQALLAANKLNGKKPSGYTFGFILGPCINSTGRLESAKEGLGLLLTEDETEAAGMAQRIVALNKERKDMMQTGLERAIELVEAYYEADHVLVIYLPELHESLAGIVAGKVREHFYKPVFVLTDSEDPQILKGSGRSIDSYHMFEAMSEIPELFTKFGGHKKAAGFSVRKEDLEKLRRTLNEREHLTEDDLIEKIHIDVPMPTSYPTVALCEELDLLAPFGQGNERPLFGELRLAVKEARYFGDQNQYIRLKLMNAEGKTAEAVEFDAKKFINCIKLWFPKEECAKMLKGLPNGVRVDVIYYPEVNEYRGVKRVQIRPVDYRKSEEKS